MTNSSIPDFGDRVKRFGAPKGVTVMKTDKGEWRNLKGVTLMYKNGLKTTKSGLHFVPSSDGARPSRGGITRFSAHARGRLREALLTTTLKDESFSFGVTLTLPWDVDKWGEEELDDFRKAWNHFNLSFIRTFPRLGMIFRIELQRRGAPHVHALVFAPSTLDWLPNDWGWKLGSSGLSPVSVPLKFPENDPRRYNFVLRVMRYELTRIWGHVINFRLWTERAALGGFDENGVEVSAVLGRGAMMRYLLDHTSKRKQAQLGYRGKQWGYLNRKVLTKELGSELELRGRALVLFNRQVAKVARYSLREGNHGKAPFGSHKTKPHHNASVRFLCSATYRRIEDWARKEAEADEPRAP